MNTAGNIGSARKGPDQLTLNDSQLETSGTTAVQPEKRLTPLPSTLGDSKELSGRSVRHEHQLSFLKEEFYVEINSPHYKKNSNVFPFYLNKEKHYRISPNGAGVEKNESVTLPMDESTREHTSLWPDPLTRISALFTHGFDNSCRVTDFCGYEGEFVSEGCCHHFANYLAFGMNSQKYVDFNVWYDRLPFASVLPFSQEELRWGDIVQLFSDGRITHSMFYIGDGIHINKRGRKDIYFQSLPAAQVAYPSDFIRTVRLLPEYYSEKLEFQESYQSF